MHINSAGNKAETKFIAGKNIDYIMLKSTSSNRVAKPHLAAPERELCGILKTVCPGVESYKSQEFHKMRDNMCTQPYYLIYLIRVLVALIKLHYVMITLQMALLVICFKEQSVLVPSCSYIKAHIRHWVNICGLDRLVPTLSC